ncbi:hypothetical protein [Streptomyces katrae]|uniref:hypothetical protein n=1 Tax=Streptomyces katrae TaxID=68223 RepID=UPI00068FBF4D|nr:hypothetical protein [Streptomyces katrae]
MNCPQHPEQAGNAHRVTVLPPDGQGARRVRCDGIGLGRAYGPADVLEFLRRAGLDLDDVTAGGGDIIEWRGGGPADWHPDRG